MIISFPIMNKASLKNGFSLVEIVVVVAVIGALAALGFAVLVKYKTPVAVVKMEQDVATLNSAVRGYLASGGSLDSVTGLEDVLAKLKTKAASAQEDEIAGLKGSFIDRRSKAVMQNCG